MYDVFPHFRQGKSSARYVSRWTPFPVWDTQTDDQSEIEYTYDLPLPPRDDPSYILPKPNDDEVESFDASPCFSSLG